MINSSEVALTASFMAMGYATTKMLTQASSQSGWGQLETVAHLTDCAERLEKLYAALPEEVRDSAPGVWAYEVAEPFGNWFALQPGIPSDHESDEQMVLLVADFFTQDAEDREAKQAALVATLQAKVNFLKKFTQQELAKIPPALFLFVDWFITRHSIRGTCDPMYVTNLVAYELGWGDGCGNFYETLPEVTPAKIEIIARRLSFSYSTCIAESNGNIAEINDHLLQLKAN